MHYTINGGWATMRSNKGGRKGRRAGRSVNSQSTPGENLERLSTKPINVSSASAKVGTGQRPDSPQLSLSS
jgi:hypothetical protein